MPLSRDIKLQYGLSSSRFCHRGVWPTLQATLVGQNLELANQTALKIGLDGRILEHDILRDLSLLGFFLLAEVIMQIFTQDVEAISNGVKCLTIVAFGYVFYGYGMVVIQSFNGAGDSRTPTIINVFIYWLFQIPLAYCLAVGNFEFGASGVFWAIAIAESLMAVVAILIFRRGKWKQVKI